MNFYIVNKSQINWIEKNRSLWPCKNLNPITNKIEISLNWHKDYSDDWYLFINGSAQPKLGNFSSDSCFKMKLYLTYI